MDKINDFYVQYTHADLMRLVNYIRRCYDKQWLMGTSGNFSLRNAFDHDTFTVTKSGLDKGLFVEQDFVSLKIKEGDFETSETAWNNALGLNPNGKPSAETSIHSYLYHRFPDLNCVMHVHNLMISETVDGHGNALFKLPNHEMLKGLTNIKSHEENKYIPVLKNDQNMAVITTYLDTIDLSQYDGFVLEHHGVYVWGHSMSDAFRFLEIYDALFKIHRIKNNLVFF
jgi:methylthioribulose-1-phosphate dehydratase